MKEHDIVLDWDNITFYVMKTRIERIKQMREFKLILIVASTSLNGYHIYLQAFSKINFKRVFRLRWVLQDDPKKLLKDMFSEKALIRNVIFKEKIMVILKYI